MHNNNNIIYIGVALIFFIDAFIDMGCTELKPWMDIIIDLHFTWKGYGRLILFSLVEGCRDIGRSTGSVSQALH
jgi:hypothetical protein